MVPRQSAGNKLAVGCVLVRGRSAELEPDEARRLRLANYGCDRNLRIMTYDTIRREVAAGHAKANAVLRANSRGYVLQSAEAMPTIMFAYMRPSELELDRNSTRLTSSH